jgi:Cysteine-rich secretory protein family
MKLLIGLSGAAVLLCLLAGCSSQSPGATTSKSSVASNAPPPAPLEEPFRSILTRWNFYRASVGVAPIVADPELNEAALHHAKYLVNNHIDAGDAVIKDGRMIENGWNASAHSESEGNSWYTEDGAKWADYANVIRGRTIPTDGAALVDEQAARLDSLSVLDPQLASVGFGIFCAADDCAGVIIYKRGLTKSQFLALYEGSAMDWNGLLGTMPFTIARLRKPIEFPPSTMHFPSRAYRGGEYPDPLVGCHGYAAPAGVPIVLQLGAPSEGEDVKISSGTVTEDGSQIETCFFDATSYANPDGYQQTRARQGLHAYGAVAVIPKNPLQPGHKYTVSIVADSQPYTWSFSIAPDAK